METLKQEIKKLVEEQKFYKNQRKTVNLVGERKISPDEASWKHAANREKLRTMYLALGIIKGMDLSLIDANFVKGKNTPIGVWDGKEQYNPHYLFLNNEATKLAEKHGTKKTVCIN